MPKLDWSVNIGSIATIISMIVAVAIGWTQIKDTVGEMKTLRAIDLQRIEKVENLSTQSQTRITDIEKQNIEFKIDLQYIKTGIIEIQNTLKQNNKSK